MSGIMPHLDSMIDKRQSGVEKRMSAPRAICSPGRTKGETVEVTYTVLSHKQNQRQNHHRKRIVVYASINKFLIPMTLTSTKAHAMQRCNDGDR